MDKLTSRAEIERLLNQTGRTLAVLPKEHSMAELIDAAHRPGNPTEIICHQSDVIKLLICTLKDLLDKSPLQKPLKLDVAKRGDRLYMEFKGDDEPELIYVIEAGLPHDLFGYNRPGSRDCRFYVDRTSYGKFWRLWAMQPTDEERTAAKWENAND